MHIFFKCPGTSFKQRKIPRDTYQFRTFSKCHRYGFPCGNSVFFCRNGFCHHNSPAGFRISANAGRNLPKIRPSLLHTSCRLPGQESTIYIYVKNQSFHCFMILKSVPPDNGHCPVVRKEFCCLRFFLPVPQILKNSQSASLRSALLP